MSNNKNVTFTGSEGCAVAIVVLLVVAAGTAFDAWIIMVLWGAIASALDLTTIGYGTAFLIAVALSVIGGFGAPVIEGPMYHTIGCPGSEHGPITRGVQGTG